MAFILLGWNGILNGISNELMTFKRMDVERAQFFREKKTFSGRGKRLNEIKHYNMRIV